MESIVAVLLYPGLIFLASQPFIVGPIKRRLDRLEENLDLKLDLKEKENPSLDSMEKEDK